MTPLLWPVWWAPASPSFSRRTTESRGSFSSRRHAVARPTMPPPTTATSYVFMSFPSAQEPPLVERDPSAPPDDHVVLHLDADLASRREEPLRRREVLRRRLGVSRRMVVVEDDARSAGEDRLAEERRGRDGRVRERAAEERGVLHEAVLGVEEEAAHDLLRLREELLRQVAADGSRIGEKILLGK